MPYDLFVSYARRDNSSGRVTQLKQRIEKNYHAYAKEQLRCFFDLDEIATMDDWRQRILEGLRESNLLLLVLSPAYLDSHNCDSLQSHSSVNPPVLLSFRAQLPGIFQHPIFGFTPILMKIPVGITDEVPPEVLCYHVLSHSN